MNCSPIYFTTICMSLFSSKLQGPTRPVLGDQERSGYRPATRQRPHLLSPPPQYLQASRIQRVVRDESGGLDDSEFVCLWAGEY